MAKNQPSKTKLVQPVKKETTPIVEEKNTISKSVINTPKTAQTFLLGRKNYIWLGISLALIFLGFIVMALDSNTYGSMALTLAPIMVLSGFGLVFYAIMLNTDTQKKEENN